MPESGHAQASMCRGDAMRLLNRSLLKQGEAPAHIHVSLIFQADFSLFGFQSVWQKPELHLRSPAAGLESSSVETSLSPSETSSSGKLMFWILPSSEAFPGVLQNIIFISAAKPCRTSTVRHTQLDSV